jgi:hypothetical protein
MPRYSVFILFILNLIIVYYLKIYIYLYIIYMVYYTCLFCRKEFLKKYNYIRHKRTEIICIEEMNKSIHKFRNMNFIKIMREIIDIMNYSKNEEDSEKSESSEKSCTQISPEFHLNCTQIAPENPKNEVLNEEPKNHEKHINNIFFSRAETMNNDKECLNLKINRYNEIKNDEIKEKNNILIAKNNVLTEDDKNLKNKIEYRCKDCNFIFSRFNSLKKHIINKICNKKKIDPYDKICQDVKQDVKEDVKQEQNTIINNTMTNNTMTNSNNKIINININNNSNANIIPFCDVKYNNLPQKLILEILSIPGLSLEKILEYIHLNEEYPELMNLLCSNRRDSFISVFNREKNKDTSKWITCDKDSIYQEIIEKYIFAIEKICNDNEYKRNELNIPKTRFDTLKRIINELDLRTDIVKDFKQKINCKLYDNSHLVKANKNKFDHILTSSNLNKIEN